MDLCPSGCAKAQPNAHSREKKEMGSIRRRSNTFPRSRDDRLALEQEFERGTRAGVAADRFYWFALGVICAVLTVALLRAI
jgi:hypothetical protein